MSYTVFARKYRPQTFEDVIGQDHITQTLRNAIEQNRLAHAYIFVGPRGTGKTSTARILAKALNCEKGPTVSPCGICSACTEIAAGNSLDVLEFDAASNTQVDKIRELIIDNVKYAPTRGKFKMYIVDEVHMLSNSSFNALLKTLEEPPAHVKFVFATTDVQKVPTTILSRCQRFDLKRISTALIAQHLLFIAKAEGLQLSAAAADTIARGAEGGMRDAESMLDQLVAFCCDKIEEADVLNVFGFTAQETVTMLCDHLLAGDAPAALGIVHAQAEAGRDLTRLLADLIAHLRNLLIAKAEPGGLADELTEEQVAALIAQAERPSMERLLDLIDQCAAAESRMKWAPNKKMHLEIAVIRAVQSLSQTSLTQVLDTLNAIRGGTAPGTAARSQESGVRSQPEPKPATRPAIEKASASNAAPKPGVAPKAAPEPAPVVHESSTATPASAASLTDPSAIWNSALTTIRNERHPLRLWASSGTLVSLEDGRAVLAFPADQALAAKNCEEPSHRQYLETLLSRLSGLPVRVQCELRENLAGDPIPLARPDAGSTGPAPDPMAEFINDPLIRKALDLFKAEIPPAGR